jgi:hypothetical protein
MEIGLVRDFVINTILLHDHLLQVDFSDTTNSSGIQMTGIRTLSVLAIFYSLGQSGLIKFQSY